MKSLRLRLRFVVGFALASCLLSAGWARADEEKKEADPAGKWNVTLELPDGQGELSMVLTMKKDGDRLTGTLVGDDAVEAELKDVSLADGELTFTLERDFAGTPLVAKFKGKLSGDTVEGTVDYDAGGQTGTAKVSAKRAVEAIAASGTWKFSIMTDDGQALEPIVKIAQDGEAVSGTFLGMDGTEVKLEEGTYKNNELAFKVTLDFGGQQLVSKFKGNVTAEGFKGSVDYDLGGQTGTLEVNGKREAEAIAASGTWKFAIMTDDGQALEPIVKITQEGEAVSGTFLGMDGTEVKLEEGTYKNNELAFKVTLDFGGQELIAKFKGNVSAEGFKGSVDYDAGGQTGTLDVTGKREGASLSGNWELVVNSDGGVFEPKLQLTHEGDKIEGTYIWEGDVQCPIKDVKLTNNELTFKVEHDFGGQPIVVVYTVTAEGDTFKGKADYDLGGQTGTATIEGKRAKSGDAGAAADVSGTWNITITSDDGQTFDVSAKLEKSDGGLKGTYTGPAGEADISEASASGDSVKFKVVRERDGQKFTIAYDGKVSGDEIKGTADYDFGGQTGTFKFEGKRAK